MIKNLALERKFQKGKKYSFIEVVILKLTNYFLILMILQSCSGGRIGNFLELSFKNIEEEKSKMNENNINSEKVITDKNFKDSNKPSISKTNSDFSNSTNKINLKIEQNLKSEEINKRQNKVINKNIIKDQNKKIKSNYDLQSYRVIIILKSVDPSAPLQNFSNVLKNANIIFEIEKIERFQENDFKK